MDRRPGAHHIGFVLLVVIWGLTGHFLIANKPAIELEEIGRLRIYSAAIVSLWLLFTYMATGLFPPGSKVEGRADS